MNGQGKNIGMADRENSCRIYKFRLWRGNGVRRVAPTTDFYAVYEIQLVPGVQFSISKPIQMQAIIYVMEGELTHGQALDDSSKLRCGGVAVIELCPNNSYLLRNMGKGILRLLIVELQAKCAEEKPKRAYQSFWQPVRAGIWNHLVSGNYGTAPVTVCKNMDIYVVRLLPGQRIHRSIAQGCRAYLLQAAGCATVNEQKLRPYDALELIGPYCLNISADAAAHMVFVQLEE